MVVEDRAAKGEALEAGGGAGPKREIPFKGVVRLTRLGGGYLIFTLIVGFAALNTGNNSLYIALSFMLGMLIFSGVASRGALRAISVELDSLDDSWANSPTPGTLRVVNRSRFWSVRDLIILAPELESAVVIPVVARRDSTDAEASFRFLKRGHAQIRRLELYTSYPFGLFLKKKVVRTEAEVIVFPELLSAREARPEIPEAGDVMSHSRPGEGQEIYALRDYVSGDSVRHIHWKKSAGLGRWIIKQSASDASGTLHLSLDTYLPPEVADDRFEEIVSEAATLVRDAHASGTEVTLHLADAIIRETPDSGLRPIFEALALVDSTRDVNRVPDYVAGAIVFSLRDEAA